MYQVQKKRHGGLLWLLLFVLAFIVGLVLGYGGITRLKAQPETVPPPVAQTDVKKPTQPEDVPADRPASLIISPTEDAPPPAEADGFLVVSQDGSVCVFRLDEAGNRVFSHKLPIVLDALREADRALLQEGIRLRDRQALLELMEDFAS